MFSKEHLKPILDDYLKKFPDAALNDVAIDWSVDGISISLQGPLPSLRIVNVIINVLLRHIIKGEMNKFLVYDISLAIEEIVLNIFHSPGSQVLSPTTIHLRFGRKNIQGEISCQTNPGVPAMDFAAALQTTPEHKFSLQGRGILLIKKAVDTLSYENTATHSILRFTRQY